MNREIKKGTGRGEINISANLVRNLNELDEDGGLFNEKYIKTGKNSHLICDYLEKINFSLQDIQRNIGNKPSRDVFICLTIYVSWIQESIAALRECYESYIFNEFDFDKAVIDEDGKFLRAIRSFVFAHPLTTNRHKQYGFDGSFVCIDIRPNGEDPSFVFMDKSDMYYLTTKGLTEYHNQSVDYWLYIYNRNKYDAIFKQYIGISSRLIIKVANDYIDYLYKLDRHMRSI